MSAQPVSLLPPIHKTCLVSVSLPVISPAFPVSHIAVYCSRIIPFYSVYKKCIEPILHDIMELSNGMICRVDEIFPLTKEEWNETKQESFRSIFGPSFCSSPDIDIFTGIDQAYKIHMGTSIAKCPVMMTYQDLFVKIKIAERRWRSSLHIFDEETNQSISRGFQEALTALDTDPMKADSTVKLCLEQIMTRISAYKKHIESKVSQNELFQRGKVIEFHEYQDDTDIVPEQDDDVQEISQAESHVVTNEIRVPPVSCFPDGKPSQSLYGPRTRGCQTDTPSYRDVGTQVRSLSKMKSFVSSEAQTDSLPLPVPDSSSPQVVKASTSSPDLSRPCSLDTVSSSVSSSSSVSTSISSSSVSSSKVRVTIRKNSYGQYVVDQYQFVYDPVLKVVIGISNPDGSIRPLLKPDQETCQSLKLPFRKI